MQDGRTLPEARLAEKLDRYRRRFDHACSGLFADGQSVTVELDVDDDEADAPALVEAGGSSAPTALLATSDAATPASATRPTPAIAGAAAATAAVSAAAPTIDALPDVVAIKRELDATVRFIAEDFAHEFNTKLAAIAAKDASIESIAPRYEMGSQHVAELQESFGETLAPLVARLDVGDFAAARRLSIAAWTPLEKRIRTKFQAYFVLTFQDVSVERKATRDRRKPSHESLAAVQLDRAEATRRARSELAAPMSWEKPSPRSLSPWVAVVALLLLALTGGWLLMRGQQRRAAVAAPEAAPSSPP